MSVPYLAIGSAINDIPIPGVRVASIGYPSSAASVCMGPSEESGYVFLCVANDQVVIEAHHTPYFK